MVGSCHVYTAELRGELVLFDTGPHLEDTWFQLTKEIDLRRLKHVFITHCHVDHCGQLNQIRAESDAVIYLSRIDAQKQWTRDLRLQLMAEELRQMGFDDEFRERLYAQGSHAGLFVDECQDYQILEDSNEPERLGIEIFYCSGHSQSDLIFKIGDEVICGDILLPGLFQTPLLEIDLSTFQGRFDSYSAYCSSLGKFKQLEGSCFFPGHLEPFTELNRVVMYYVSKLRERAEQLKRLDTGIPVRMIVEKLFGPVMDKPVFSFLKASEIVFMLDYLAQPEMINSALQYFLSTDHGITSQTAGAVT